MELHMIEMVELVLEEVDEVVEVVAVELLVGLLAEPVVESEAFGTDHPQQAY